jgi:hypothetical protein
MKKVEIAITVISMISIVMYLFLIPESSLLIIVSFLLLVYFYSFIGFALFNGIRLMDVTKKASYKNISEQRIIGAIGAGIALSITVLGIMMYVLAGPGGLIILPTGLILLAIVTVVGYIKYSKNKSGYYIEIFKRIVFFSGLGISLFLTPKFKWLDIRYREHPAYLNALKKANADPDNEELWKNVDIEEKKMDNEKGK